MNKRVKAALLLLLIPAAVCGGRFTFAEASQNSPGIWVTAYYPVWEQQSNLPPDKVDYTAFTNLIQFSVLPTSAGAIDQSSPTAVTPAISQAVIVPAHAAGDKVLIGVGGQGSGAAFSAAIAGPVRSTFEDNLVQFVESRGYDGVDIDMEPISDADAPNFKLFVRELRVKLNGINPKLLLTAAATPEPGNNPAMFDAVQDSFDEINIMTYDLSGTWDGWKTWYNSSLYGDGSQYMIDTVSYPSVTAVLQRYADAGIPKSKLGIGIAFYGDIWSGATGPTQSISGVTTKTIGYNAIMDQYYTTGAYHWDSTAHAPYLSIMGATAVQNKFISYDNPKLAVEKVDYAREQHLGGITLFEIGDGYRPSQPEGSKDELLQAVKQAWKGPLPKDPLPATGQ